MFNKVEDRLSVNVAGTFKTGFVIASLLDLETSLGAPTDKAALDFSPEWIYLDEDGFIFTLYDHYNYSVNEPTTEKIRWSIGSKKPSTNFKNFINKKLKL